MTRRRVKYEIGCDIRNALITIDGIQTYGKSEDTEAVLSKVARILGLALDELSNLPENGPEFAYNRK